MPCLACFCIGKIKNLSGGKLKSGIFCLFFAGLRLPAVFLYDFFVKFFLGGCAGITPAILNIDFLKAHNVYYV